MIVGTGVDHHGRAVGIEERGRAGSERHPAGEVVDLPRPVRRDIQVRQVPSVGSLRIGEAVLLSLW